MSITLKWADQTNQTMIAEFVGPWRWSDIASMHESLLKYHASVNHRIDLLIDIRQSSVYESDAIEHVRANYLDTSMEHFRLLMCIGADYFTQTLWNVFTSLPFAEKFKVHFFETFEEAIEFSRTYTPET